MKKIMMGMAVVMGVMSLAGCDKIEPEEYTIYDGVAVTWSEGTEAVAPVQRAYVEKYTGPKCSNCPKADATLGAIHNERVVVVSINHPTGQGVPFPNQPDLRNAGGNAWDAYFGINAIPAAYINRSSSQYQGEMGTIEGDINKALAEAPTVALAMKATASGATVSVGVDLQFVKQYSSPVTLTVAIVEDSLVYKQMLPDNTVDADYVHNHMLRKVVTGFWGRDVEARGDEDEKVHGALTFTADDDIVLAHSHVVAFVSDKATRRVLNCVACKISEE